MRYCVLYPKTENVHLIKDVGMIAFKLHQNFNYDSFIASYENGAYEYLDNEVKGLKIDFIDKKHNDLINTFIYLRNHARSIDVLQIFHMTLNSVFYAFIFKLFNRKGLLFLKLDCTEELVNKIKNASLLKKLFINSYLNKVDIIGVEQKNILSQLKKILKKNSAKLLHIPNGVDFNADILKNTNNFEEKENIILTVGRIGSPEKANEVLMEAFALLDEDMKRNWRLVLVGPVEENFKSYINEYFIKHPELKKTIEFPGAVYDRALLYEYYKKSKLFCLTSKFESFGIVLIEAAAFGDVIVSTSVGIAEELIQSNNGVMLKNNDVAETAEALNNLINDKKLSSMSKTTRELCKRNFDWNEITSSLHKTLDNLKRS